MVCKEWAFAHPRNKEKKELLAFKDEVLGKAEKQTKDIEMGGVGKGTNEGTTEPKNVGSDKCKVNGFHAKSKENPRCEVTSPSIGNYIQCIKYHALIRKFMGIWPLKKYLMGWVSSRWKVKGQVDLKLGSKGFFTTIFSNPSNRDKVFEEGPYFFNFSCLHLCYWTECFALEKDDFMVAPIWIRLYSMLQEFWEIETLKGIGNTMGSFTRCQRS